MPAGSVSWELRNGIIVRLTLAIAALVALALAWYALNSTEPRSPLPAPAADVPVVASSSAAASEAMSAQLLSAGPTVREQPPAPTAMPEDSPTAPDTLHSEGMIRTVRDPASADKSESPTVALASAPPPTAQPKLPGGAYVQVGVFAHPANAEEIKAKLEAAGIPVVIATRVQVGPFKSKKEAEEMRQKLKAMGMASIVINQ